MDWQPFSNHFRQRYDQNYRYLDSCGEFMIRAVSELDYLPGETLVTGAKLEKPEQMLRAEIDTAQFVVTQEQSGDANSFLRECEQLASLVQRIFSPTAVSSNGFAQKLFVPFNSPDAALKASLSLAGEYHTVLSKEFGMPASHKRLEYHFRSGSYEFNAGVQPVTFERVASARFNADFRSSSGERRRVDRLNQRTERIRHSGAAHALMMDLDLIEHEPPAASLGKHFEHLMEMKATAMRLFHIL